MPVYDDGPMPATRFAECLPGGGPEQSPAAAIHDSFCVKNICPGGSVMNLIANGLVALVAALHVYFLILEMFLWTKPRGLKTFGNSLEKATESAVLAANQGLYNGFLAAGLIWGLFHGAPAFALQIKTFFLLCVIVAGVYGAATVSRKILFVQALPAALALIALWLT